jgi:hypothetical protein
VNEDNKFFAQVIAGVCAFVFALFLLFAYLSSVECKQKWEYSGMKSDFGVMKGCVVQRKDGTWIPDSTFREIKQ